MANNMEDVELREKIADWFGSEFSQSNPFWHRQTSLTYADKLIPIITKETAKAELRGQVHIIKQEHSWISDVNDGIAYNLEKTIEQLEAQLKTLTGEEVSND